MDKPEFCWINFLHGGDLEYSDMTNAGFYQKFRITYNEAGKVIRLERVEE